MDNDDVDYLMDGFDPSSLTVPRLRSILVTHNVQYSATAKKPQLIELFNKEVVPQAKRYLAVRARAKRSSMGITNADERVVVAGAFAEGFTAVEGERAYYNGVLGNLNGGGTGRRFGGTGGFYR